MGFTRGPWVVEPYNSLKEAQEDGAFEWCSEWKRDDVFKGPVASVWQVTERGDYTGLPGNIEVSLANAHLIAAAPDMYEVLADIQERWDEGESSKDILRQSRKGLKAALALARGEVE